MLSVVCLIIGTCSVLMFIYMIKKGKECDHLVENLDEQEFQLKELYSVGFAWEKTVSVLSFYGPLAKRIRTDVVLLYGEKYAEFYTRIILAKAYTYAHLIFCFFAVVSGMVKGASSLLMVTVGIVMAAMVAINTINDTKNKVKNRTDEYLIEFPDVATKLALMIDSGMILREAWFLVTKSTKGTLKYAMEQTCELMKNGQSDMDAIYYFGQHSGAKDIKKFASVIAQGISKGSSDLSALLMQQSAELWQVKRQRMLQKGEEAATKLVIPTTLMFVGIILVILTSAMRGMSL